MLQDTQPEFEWPAILRLPQVPPLQVPTRRQTRCIAQPAPVGYIEVVPATPPLAPENDLFTPVPVTPPLTHQPQLRMHGPGRIDIGDMTVSILPDEKLGDCRDAMDRVRPGSALVWSGRDPSRPYSREWKFGITCIPVRGYITTGRRSREVGNGEFLLGCAFLIFMAVLALVLLTWLSSVR